MLQIVDSTPLLGCRLGKCLGTSFSTGELGITGVYLVYTSESACKTRSDHGMLIRQTFV